MDTPQPSPSSDEKSTSSQAPFQPPFNSGESFGFLGALLDFSFTQFITTKLIKILYFIVLVLLIIGGIFFIISGFVASFMSGLFALIIAPLGVFLYVCLARLWSELTIVIFRIYEELRELNSKTK